MKKIITLFVLFTANRVFTQPTPCITSPLFYDTTYFTPVLINEVLSQGFSGESWVEFYNCRDTTVDIGGWFLTNDPTDSFKFQINQHYLMDPGEFRVVMLPFTISLSFGLVSLWRPDSTMAYGVTFDEVSVGQSIGFCDNMIVRMTASPGVPNHCTISSVSHILDPDIVPRYYDFFGREVFGPKHGLYIAIRGSVRKKIWIQ